MITPSGLMMNPEAFTPHRFAAVASGNGWPRKERCKRTVGTEGIVVSLGACRLPSELSSPCEFREADILLTTLMLTTAGPYFCHHGAENPASIAGRVWRAGAGRRGSRARGSGPSWPSAEVATAARVAPATVTAHRPARQMGGRAEDCGQ